MTVTTKYLEDYQVGETFSIPAKTLTDAHFVCFAALTGDQHPIHYDDDYAKTTRFGRPIVHGLHLMALTALGATPLSEQLKGSMVAMLSQSATFQRPVFKDDVVRSQFEIASAQPRPGR